MSCRQPSASFDGVIPSDCVYWAFQAAGTSAGWSVAGNQLLLQLEANHDVQVVRDLVRLDADEARLHVVDGRIKLVARHRAERLGKFRLRLRIKMLPEGLAATDEVLPHPRLRLVNAQRGRFTDRRAESLPVETLLIKSVPRLVQHAEERAGEVMFVVARGQPAVARTHPAAERMGRFVEPPVLKTEADRGRCACRKFGLGGFGVSPGQDRDVRPLLRVGDRPHQWNERLPQRGKDLRDIGRFGSRLVIVEQRVVGDAVTAAPPARPLPRA